MGAMEPVEIEERIRGIAEKVAADHGLELVHVDIGVLGRNAVMRVFIDKPGGVTHEDCSAVSHHVGTILDVEDFVSSTYTLEVSSPGLERGLYKRADYERFAGRDASVKLKLPRDGRRRFEGRLVGIEDGKVVLDVEGNRQLLALEDIDRARLVPDV